ncbi:glycyl aminopeptidase [Haladaptatus salinisoli]|uniref:glycyl aminopeptidase n=1 Tax=Haladaptatus salinisoli TaxID=2884876 RepID=UPI001D0B9825|nr:glycyl aminopeptidase [Haladaptatus salinisoli]
MALEGWVSGGTVSLLLVFSLVTAGVSAPATAQSTAEPPGVSISVERNADDAAKVRYHLEFETPQRAFWLINYTGNVVSSEGFVADRTKDGNHALRWDSETKSPSVTVVANVGNGSEYAATDKWVLAPTPRLTVAWSPGENGEWRYDHLLDDDYPGSSVEFANSGVLGSMFTYVGPYEERIHRADGQRFRMVIGAGATPASPPRKVFESLGTASEHFPGESPDEVLLFVLSDPIWRGGYASPQSDEFWVHEDARLSDPQNLWIHEYVHTRQSFTLGERMRWFREASASYFASDLTIRQDRTSQSAVARTLSAKQYDEAVLSRPTTWVSREVPYYQGALMLWALDAKIQNATGEKRSLMDVFYRMNRHEGPVTYTDFEKIVADVAGKPMDTWLARYVTTPANLNVQGLKGGIGEGKTDGSGVDDSTGGKASGGNDSRSDGDRPPAMIGDLPSTLMAWSGLGFIGLMFGWTVAKYLPRLVDQLRNEKEE